MTFFEFELPCISYLCENGTTVTPHIDNVWENYELQNIVSHDLYNQEYIGYCVLLI